MPQHDNSKSKQNVSNVLENRWLKCKSVFCLNRSNKRKRNTTKVLSCITYPFRSQIFPSKHTHTYKAAAPCWRNGGVHGHIYSLLDHKTASSRTVSKGSQSETRVDFISPVQSSWLLFHISTASTFLLWRLLLLHQEPKHKGICIQLGNKHVQWTCYINIKSII